MKLSLSLAVAAFILMAPISAQARKNALFPSAILKAKSVCIENQTGFAEFQNYAYMELSAWGRFHLEQSAQRADLILRITGSSSVRFVPGDDPTRQPTAGPSNGGDDVPAGYARVALIDPRTGQTLWSDLRKTNGPQAKGRLLETLRAAIDLQESNHKPH